MEKEKVYIKLQRHIQKKEEDVFLKDVASVFCNNDNILSKVKSMKIYHFNNKKEQRVIISIVKIIELLVKDNNNLEIESLGEEDVIIQQLSESHKSKGFLYLKIVVVASICFWGTAFSIMTFHNDVGLQYVLQKIYFICTGIQADQPTILEWSYTIGLALGIILFYNHIGGRRLDKDPTPLEVEIRNYERDINQTLVETADREKKEIEVES